MKKGIKVLIDTKDGKITDMPAEVINEANDAKTKFFVKLGILSQHNAISKDFMSEISEEDYNKRMNTLREEERAKKEKLKE